MNPKTRLVAVGRRFKRAGKVERQLAVEPSWAMQAACAACTPSQQAAGCTWCEVAQIEEVRHGRR